MNMNSLAIFMMEIFEITLLDLALCGDNIGVIALATRNLSAKKAKLASFIGISGAIVLRIIFACFITLILAINWLPIKLVGGILLIKVTWDFVKPGNNEETETIKESRRFWQVVYCVIIADISMSLDNVLAIAGTADGNVLLIIFGIALNIPIIFFGSQFVADLMKKYTIVIYLGAAILCHTAFQMILEDNLVVKYIQLSEVFTKLFPWIMALITLIYGISMIEHNERARKS